VDRHQKNTEIWQRLLAYCESNPPDVLILAGDISNCQKSFKDALGSFSQTPFPKLIVPGNHDLWCINEECTSMEKFNKILPEICEKSGWHWLPKNPLIIDSVAFVGTPGWYDYSLMPKDHPFTNEDFEKKQNSRGKWMDVEHCNWVEDNKYLDDHQITEHFYNQLEQDILEIKKQNPKSIVMVSHFLFDDEFLNFRNDWEFNYFGAFMGSKKFQKLRHDHEVSLHVFGHLHRKDSLKKSNVTIELNPVGYIREWEHDSPENQLSHILGKIEI
jgi:putative phosphoesterase